MQTEIVGPDVALGATIQGVVNPVEDHLQGNGGVRVVEEKMANSIVNHRVADWTKAFYWLAHSDRGFGGGGDGTRC